MPKMHSVIIGNLSFIFPFFLKDIFSSDLEKKWAKAINNATTCINLTQHISSFHISCYLMRLYNKIPRDC